MKKSLQAIVWLVAASPSLAQSNVDISLVNFNFNRSLPGARSLAMGGAFVALADDASSAYSNPAGLTILPASQVSTEYRWWEYETRFTERGRASGTPTGIGIDVVDGVISGESSSKTEGLSFASFVYRPRKAVHWAFAAYSHKLVNFSSNIKSQGTFNDGEPPRFGPHIAQTDFEVDSIGASIAYQFGDCVQVQKCYRVGLSLAEATIDFHTLTRILRDPGNFGEATFREQTVARARTDSEDEALTASAGLLWQPNETLTVGAAFRSGPEFDATEMLFGPSNRRFTRLKLPDQYSLGASWALGKEEKTLFLVSEATYVPYSQMTKDNGLELFEVDDGIELRMGLEKRTRLGSATKTRFVNLMAGAWFDPDHRIEFTGDINVPRDRGRNSQFGEANDNGDVHGTAGIGFVYGRFQLDVAGDFSERTQTLAASFVVEF